ncbi:MAG: hypothetical protein Q3M30_11735 [Candidatus Electrothrix sp. Rat3]|nr:hypothetical protein [Candidatus Electrothrix rattekaaiensis]
MNTPKSSKSTIATALISTFLHGSVALAGENIQKKYHITKPKGNGVDVNVTLTEASGLALSHSGKSLWTISDENKKYVFKMTLQGDPKDSESFKLLDYPYAKAGIEGICLSADGQYMYIVDETEFAIIPIKITPGSIEAKVMSPPIKIKKLPGYKEKVAPYLLDKKNKGPEGITVHTCSGDIYVLIEQGRENKKLGPLLVRIDNTLKEILEARVLTKDQGFIGVAQDEAIDGSGIDFDRTDVSKNRFYIVSDKGERVFLYDWDTNTGKVVRDLGYKHGEGIAYDPAGPTLYIVTDGGSKNDSKLYRYEK